MPIRDSAGLRLVVIVPAGDFLYGFGGNEGYPPYRKEALNRQATY